MGGAHFDRERKRGAVGAEDTRIEAPRRVGSGGRAALSSQLGGLGSFKLPTGSVAEPRPPTILLDFKRAKQFLWHLRCQLEPGNIQFQCFQLVKQPCDIVPIL